MAIVINGSGTVTGISVGGLPDNIVDSGTLASDALDSAVAINSSNADVDFKVGCETGATNVDVEDYALWVEGSTGNIICGADTSTDAGSNFQLTRSGTTTMEIFASENSSARDANLTLHTRHNAAQCRIRFKEGSGGGTTKAQIYYNHDGETIYFTTEDDTQRAQLNSNGLCFGTDTAAANALDDYEEGTWTPVIGSGTINVARATYAKVGNIITVTCYINTFSDYTTGTFITVTGLPYTSASSGYHHGTLKTAYLTNKNNVCSYVGQSSSTLTFHEWDSGGDYASILHSSITNDSSATRIFATITYMTD